MSGGSSGDCAIALRTATDLLGDIRHGRISSAALLELFVRRSEALNSELNAVVVWDLERARVRAAQADAALARGESWGPLHGLPMTVKENNDVAGLPTTKGDPQKEGHLAPDSEVMIERLLAAGAVVFGKSNLPLNAMDIQSYNKLYGSTCNPWELSRTPGGSSGGGAAAVAAGLSPLEIGGDIGGSVRIPAAFCGIYGHKPTFGIIPKRSSTMSLVPTDISVRGPLTRSAEDLALLMEVLAGGAGTAGDVANVGRGWRLQLPRPTKARLSEYRVAVWATDQLCPVSHELQAAADALVAALRRCGATVDCKARPAGFDAAENLQVYETLMASSAAGFGVDPGISYKRWFDHNERREEFCRCWSRFFTEWDVLICPSYSMVAFPKDETPPADGQQMGTNRTLDRDGERIPYWQSQFWPILTNTCRLPSTTFPAGLGSTSGMPVGLNAVGAEFDDLKTIHFAQLLATECGVPYTYTAPPFALAAAVTSPKL